MILSRNDSVRSSCAHLDTAPGAHDSVSCALAVFVAGHARDRVVRSVALVAWMVAVARCARLEFGLRISPSPPENPRDEFPASPGLKRCSEYVTVRHENALPTC